MTTEEANNRGFNFAAVSFAAALGIGFAAAVPSEDELVHKVDEATIPLVASALVVWYLTGRHKYSRSVIPIAAVALTLIIKLIWFGVEFNDQADRGDDLGLSIVLGAFFMILSWTYFRRTSSLKPAPGRSSTS
ncbi:MAG TPA: hypothetical protein VNA65_03865 [Candidatus Dormibacteraeota bacterium]|nr:hypothetical protein [Candidatus Dormibacteraeota bacterium]